MSTGNDEGKNERIFQVKIGCINEELNSYESLINQIKRIKNHLIPESPEKTSTCGDQLNPICLNDNLEQIHTTLKIYNDELRKIIDDLKEYV
jgi:hypothetical protein